LRVAIVGSRGYPRMDLVRRLVDSLDIGDRVVSGGAAGVDTEAETRACERGMVPLVCVAPWKALGRRAGMARNAVIVREADRVYVFWDGESPGTKSTIGLARAAGKLEMVIGPDGKRMVL
jgi:hypothetical protein